MSKCQPCVEKKLRAMIRERDAEIERLQDLVGAAQFTLRNDLFKDRVEDALHFLDEAANGEPA